MIFAAVYVFVCVCMSICVWMCEYIADFLIKIKYLYAQTGIMLLNEYILISGYALKGLEGLFNRVK